MKGIVCVNNYNHDENAVRLFNFFKEYYQTYILDTFHKEKGGKLPIDDDNIIYLDNIYEGGLFLKDYDLVKENDADYMLSIESDVLINDENLQRLKKSFNRVMDVGDVGAYQPSLTMGCKPKGLL